MTLQQQYNLITEGKGNKANFLKNAKFQFPNLFNNFTSYEDSVNVLKSKGLITEGTNGVGGVVTGGREQDWVKIFKQNISEEVKAEERKTSKEVEDVQAHGFDYKDDKNIDNVYGQAFLHGFYTEMQDPKNEEKTTNEVKEIVAKNLAKDRLHYTKDGMFGVKGVGYTTEAPGLGTPKEPKGKYKSSGYGDLREGMYGNSDGDFDKQEYNKWKEELYDVIKKDTGYTDDDIEVDDEQLTKYFKDGKSAEEVYYKEWLQDVGNYLKLGEGWEENQPLKKGEEQTFEPIPPSKSQAHTAGDKLRADMEKHVDRAKLKEVIRELILKELEVTLTDPADLSKVPSNVTKVTVAKTAE